jgi:hypothetical protein
VPRLRAKRGTGRRAGQDRGVLSRRAGSVSPQVARRRKRRDCCCMSGSRSQHHQMQSLKPAPISGRSQQPMAIAVDSFGGHGSPHGEPGA